MTFFWVCFGLLSLYTLAVSLAHIVHWVKIKLHPKKSEEPMLGVFDFYDMGSGRVSGSDKEDGTRQRSFGQTVFTAFSWPLVFLTVTYGASMVIISYSTRPTVSIAETINYQVCLKKAKNSKEKAKCKAPKAKVGKSVAKLLDGGKWPWIGAIVLFLGGLFFALSRSNQDFKKAERLLEIGLQYAKEGKSMPGHLSSATSSALSKATTAIVSQGEEKATPTQEKPASESEVQNKGSSGRIDAP